MHSKQNFIHHQNLTSISIKTDKDEQHLMNKLTANLYDLVLVVSDLHLGLGRSLVTGTYHLTENFFADEAFCHWLSHHQSMIVKSKLLVLNGDIFDFLRISSYPKTSDDSSRWRERLARLDTALLTKAQERTITPIEHRFGLRTQDYNSLWKLLLIMDGHQPFFKALADWITAEGKLVFVKGNHDLELHWPLIRQAIRDEIARNGAGVQVVEEHVAFAGCGFLLGNLYFEHGHQYEHMTRVEGNPVLDKDPTQLNLPLGSFINRYFINKIERLNPFLDNIKPVNQAFLALLRKRPFEIIFTYFYAWRFVLRAMIGMKRFCNHAVALILAALLVPVLTVAAVAAFIFVPDLAALLKVWIPILNYRLAYISGSIVGILFPLLSPYLLNALQELLRGLGFFRPRDHVRKGAQRTLQRVFDRSNNYRRVYAVMGHTHMQDVHQLASTGHEEFYVNSGTWIPLWPQDRLDLIGQIIYTFARFDLDRDNEYRHQALEWDDHAKEPRPARILSTETN